MKETKKLPTITAPSVEDIKKRFSSYQKYYSQLHKDQKDMDDFYELTFDAEVPSLYTARIPSTARDWIDVGVRHFTLDNPKATVRLRKNTDAARQQVGRLEALHNFFLALEIVKIKEAAKKLLLRGEVFLKILMDDTYFGRDDEERLFHFPLFIAAPDPINTFPSPAHNGLVPHDVIESFNITASEAVAMCERNGWNWKTKKAPDANVKWFSYIDANYRYFSLDDRPVLTPEVQPSLLGFCNYVHIDAGSGQSNFEGKPEYKHRSFIWGKKDMLRLEVRLLSAIDAINMRYAFPRYKARGDPTAIKNLYPHQIPTDPNELLREIPDQVELDVLKGEQPPEGLFREYALLQAQAQPPQVLSGVKPPGVYSGLHQEALVGTAKPMYKDAFKNLEGGLGVIMGMGARIIEQVYNYPVEIKNFASADTNQYDQIKPSDIKGHYDCEVQLLAEPPEATDIRKALGKSLRVAGSISHLMEKRDYQNLSQEESENELAQTLAEGVMAEIGFREGLGKDAMDRLGMTRELEAIEEAEQRLTTNKPPIQKGGGVTMGEGMVKQRGRSSPELESSTSTGEHGVQR